MMIQKIGDVWHIEDKATDTVTKDNVMARGISNALYKHIAFKGTENPLKTNLQYISEYEAIKARKEAVKGARLVTFY